MNIKDTYHLPLVDKCIDKSGDARQFQILDEYYEYLQIKVRKKFRSKPAF